MRLPIHVPTRETVEFVASHLAPGGEVLEVGCGGGHVAAELLRRGFQVRAIDANAESVAEARARGVPAIEAVWPHADVVEAGAVAFTHSLHHIGPLAPALDRARSVVGERGVLIVEDFARETPPAALAGFAERVRGSTLRHRLVLREGGLVTDLLRRGDAERVWIERHDRPDVHSVAAMLEAVRERFAQVETARAPHLYRYLVHALPETPEAAAWLEEMLEWERGLGAEAWAGRRIVARAG